ncbi:FkbM family methyltransferase [Thermonema rossianum]|uniref:FkbM family methyltransferase n=1 Tax=Thermonema rossianum TaxID=55505 RepID=UPI0006925C1A|nr:FkbM family methyltransferase [Thermonema rossianum]
MASGLWFHQVKRSIKHWRARLLYQKAFRRAFFLSWALAWQEVRHSFRQFFTRHSPLWSLLRVLRYASLSALRPFFGRSARLSYAFTGEDRLIESLLKPPFGYRGFYVEVGCNHPVFISNSFTLYRQGWRGICIDANPRLIRLFKYYRPRDIAVHAFVSNQTGEVDFVELSNDVLSSADKTYIERMLTQEIAQNIEQVHHLRSRRLTDILDACHCPAHFDFLSIDAEEHDYDVLLSLDLERYRPRLIVIEDEHFDPLQPQANRIVQHLHAHAYRLAGYVLTNLYFIDEQQM